MALEDSMDVRKDVERDALRGALEAIATGTYPTDFADEYAREVLQSVDRDGATNAEAVEAALVDVAAAAGRARTDARKGPGPFADAMTLLCRALDRLEEVRRDL